MLSARSLLREMFDHDEAFRLVCSLAAAGEAQGGWENARIAALIDDPVLAPKIARHGADEERHGRIFTALLRRRALEPVPVEPATDYVGALERAGIGVAHARLRAGIPLTGSDVVDYLAHGRVTEHRGAAQMRAMLGACAGHEDLRRALTVVARDERHHLAYCHEELLRLTAAGHGRAVQAALHRAARTEIRIYRDVSVAVIRRMATLLGWPPLKVNTLVAGSHAAYAAERAGSWRRLTTLRPPEVRDALGAGASAPAGEPLTDRP